MLQRNLAMIATLVAFLSVTSAWAEGGEQGRSSSPEKFQAMKNKMLENHQKRIQVLQNAQSCIQGATAPDQLKTCREQERSASKQLHQENKQERESMREKMREERGGGAKSREDSK